MSKIELGKIRIPSGNLLILDPGLAREWSHDQSPNAPFSQSPRSQVDFKIVGPDAIQAGKAFDRQFNPEFIFDMPEPDEFKTQFEAFLSTEKFDAQLETLERRMSHVERAKASLEFGDGLGIVQYSGMWAVVVGGVPSDRELTLVGEIIEEGEFAGRFRTVDINIDPEATIARTERLEGVMVDHGQLVCSDLDVFGDFRMWDPQDGLADYVFWGKDAAGLAERVSAKSMPEEQFGWKDVPMDQIGERAQAVEGLIEEEQLQVGVDFRPHCNLNRLNSGMRSSEIDAATIEIGGHPICGFANRWGDGIFPIVCEYDADDRLVCVRMDVGNETRQDLMRQVIVYHSSSVVTKKVWVDGLPIQFADRLEPEFDGDSGWLFTSGTEDQAYMDNAENFQLLHVKDVVDRCPELKPIITADTGSQFHREGDKFVPG